MGGGGGLGPRGGILCLNQIFSIMRQIYSPHTYTQSAGVGVGCEGTGESACKAGEK